MNYSKRSEAGFSFLEVLLVFMVIVAMSAVAIPVFKKLSGEGRENKDRSNAQQLVSTFTASNALGVDWISLADGDLPQNVTAEPGSEECLAVIRALVKGYTIEEQGNMYNGQAFGLKTLAVPDQISAANYVALQGGNLVLH